MAFQQGATTSFKVQLSQGLHNFGPTNPNTFYIALFNGSATLGPSTTQYVTGLTGEVVGAGYTTGGQALTINTTPTSGSTGGTVAYWSFNNVIWTSASFVARGALIYNASQNNASVCVLDFGSDKVCSNSFTVQFPTAGTTTAILRIS